MYVLNDKGLIDFVGSPGKGQEILDERVLADELIDATLKGDNASVVNKYASVNEAAKLLSKYLGTFSPPPMGGCCG